jgi:hypothetical protein
MPSNPPKLFFRTGKLLYKPKITLQEDSQGTDEHGQKKLPI